MKILMRNKKSENWKLVESVAYGAEAKLQELLADSPTIALVDAFPKHENVLEQFKAAVETLGRQIHSEK